MNGEENQRARKRFKALENLIKKEFPNEKFKYEEDKTLIKVSRRKFIAGLERKPNIVFHPDYDFMTDLDSDFEETVKQGIQIAKNILENPPFKNKNFQGDISLKLEGATFKAWVEEK